MRDVRCTYCSKYSKKLVENGRCEECNKEYKEIVAGIIKRYGGAIKKLAER
jgi:hypothetical protein